MRENEEKEGKFVKPVMFYSTQAWRNILEQVSRDSGMSKSEILRQGLFSFMKSKQFKEKKSLMGN